MCETALPKSSVLSCRLFRDRILKNVSEGIRRGWRIILWSFSLVSYLCQVQAALFPPWPGGGNKILNYSILSGVCAQWRRRLRSSFRESIFAHID